MPRMRRRVRVGDRGETMSGWPEHDKLDGSTEFEVAVRFLDHLRAHGFEIRSDGAPVRYPGPELDRAAAEFVGVDYDRLMIEADLIVDEATAVRDLVEEHTGPPTQLGGRATLGVLSPWL